jgi:molybdenum cofactor cytidylyltransferase
MPTTETENRPFFSGVILAAGASTRMGRPNQLLRLGGEYLLQRVIDHAAASRLDEIVVVLGYLADEIRDAIRLPAGRPARVVINSDYDQGQSTSLRVGLRSTDPRAIGAAVLLGDQPHVSPSLIDRIAAAFLSARSPVVRPVYSRSGRRVPGHPVFLGRTIWPDVERLRGDQGARLLVSAHPDWLLEVPVEGEPPADVDTWEDYQRAVRTS